MLEFHTSVPTPFILMLRPSLVAKQQWISREDYVLYAERYQRLNLRILWKLVPGLVAPIGDFFVTHVVYVETEDIFRYRPRCPIY